MLKRGATPLLSVVLLIGFTVLISILVTTWSIQVMEKLQERAEESQESYQDYKESIIGVEGAFELKGIPNQIIDEGIAFNNIDLNGYLLNVDNREVIWRTEKNNHIRVSIENGIATLTYSNFIGVEQIIFVAIDVNTGIRTTDTATFEVKENILGNHVPTVDDIPGQSITEGGTFTSFDLDDYASDPDEGDVLTWTYTGNSQITVSKDVNNVITLTYPEGFLGSETIIFKATDIGGLWDQDSTVFEVSEGSPEWVYGDYPQLGILHYDASDITLAMVPEFVKYDVLIFDSWLARSSTGLQILDEIKEAKPEIIILGYVSSEELNVQDYYDPAWEYSEDCGENLACLIYKNIEPEWFLYDVDGNHIWSWKSPTEKLTYAFNPSTQCPEVDGEKLYDWLGPFLYDNFPSVDKFDGFMVDNVFESISWLETGPSWEHQEPDLDMDGSRSCFYPDCLSDFYTEMNTYWSTGVHTLMQNFRSAVPSDFIFVCNGQHTNFESCNGRFFEDGIVKRGWDGSMFAPYGYFEWMDNHYGSEHVTFMEAWNCDGDYRKMRYTLTGSLMGDGGYYECDTGSDDVFSWFDEYAVDLETGQTDETKRGYLGNPKGPYQILSGGVYRRDFDNGIVLVNPVTPVGYSQEVTLEKEYRKIDGVQDPITNNGETVNSVWLRESDGIILLNVLE